MDLISTYLHSRNLSDRVIVYGSCIENEWPDILAQVGEGMTRLSVCPERDHINTITAKCASLISHGGVKELKVLTKDGSPHCIGLHYAVEAAARTITKSDDLKLNYYVIEHGKLFHVPEEKIREKRHLSR